MGIRDDEISRLMKYSEGLGLTVTFKKAPYGGRTGAEWALTADRITVYEFSSDTKTTIILRLIHELGHHLDFVYNNRRHRDAIINAYEFTAKGKKIPKRYRKIIYDDECNGAAYHLTVWHELNLKIPKWKVEVERDAQLVAYKYEYVHGAEPSNKHMEETRQKLREKYRK